MAKIRIYNPKNGRQHGLNTDHVTKFIVDHLVDIHTNKRVEGFCIHVFTSDGKEFRVNDDRGGLELLELLEAEFYPLNKRPVISAQETEP